jgi:hypothetical protein
MVINPSCTQTITLHEDLAKGHPHFSYRRKIMGKNQGSLLTPMYSIYEDITNLNYRSSKTFRTDNLLFSTICNVSYFCSLSCVGLLFTSPWPDTRSISHRCPHPRKSFSSPQLNPINRLASQTKFRLALSISLTCLSRLIGL